MPLTILSVAFPFAPVGPAAVGGAEQVLSAIDAELVARGDRSIVVACQGSEPAGTLYDVPLPSTETLNDADRIWVRKRFQAAIDRAIGAHPVDLVHMHGLDFADYILPRNLPVLATLHLPVSWYGEALSSAAARRASLCCVSESQRRTCPRGLGPVAVVQNGVEIPPLPPRRERDNFALVLGRICAEKNAHEALEAGTLAGTPVYVAGRVFPYAEHQRYFKEKLQPLLQDSADSSAPVRHRFLGPIDAQRRTALLSRAKCLLHPTLAPETSSLVAMEALAAGTPVIAYRSGALPEIVTDGVTGFLVESAEQMAQAIGRVHLISPDACRAEALRRFSRARMVDDYRQLYAQILADLDQARRYA